MLASLWTQASGVAIDPTGGITVVGFTASGFGGTANTNGSFAAFLARYDSEGNPGPITLWGSADTYGCGVAHDVFGNTWVVGTTSGGFDGQSGSQWSVSKFAPDGNRRWTRIWGGTSGTDPIYEVAVSSNAVFAFGAASGLFDGQLCAGPWDLAVTK